MRADPREFAEHLVRNRSISRREALALAARIPGAAAGPLFAT